MNIIEAVKSGKRFKLKFLETYMYFHEHRFSEKEILSNDWEVEDEPVTITREQFDKAWDNVLTLHKLDRDTLAKELGL